MSTSATDAISTSAVQQSTNLAPNGTNLLGHWSFDEGSGTRAEDFSSSGANAGTLVGSPTWADGRMDKAISFDGTDDWVDVGSSSSLNTTADYTISMWVYNAAGSDLYPTLLNRAGQATNNGFFWIYTNGTNEADLNFQYADGTNYFTNTFSGALSTNTWQHVMFTFDNTSKSLKLYINGNQFSTTQTLAGSLPIDDGTLYLGTYNGLATDYSFQGRLDDVRIYARALTSGEATDLYQSSAQTKVNVSQNSRVTNGLVGLWSFNGSDVSGTTAYDRSGQGNDGTLTGGPTPIIGKVGQGMNFDGNNDYMLSINNLPISGDAEFTMCAWIKGMGAWSSGHPSFMGNNRTGTTNTGLSFTMKDGRPAVDFWNNRFRASNALNIGSWYFVCGTKTPGVISSTTNIYVDGVIVSGAVEGADTTPNITLTPAVIGRLDGTRYFSGLVDEARVYNRALTAAEITDLYNQGR